MYPHIWLAVAFYALLYLRWSSVVSYRSNGALVENGLKNVFWDNFMQHEGFICRACPSLWVLSLFWYCAVMGLKTTTTWLQLSYWIRTQGSSFHSKAGSGGQTDLPVTALFKEEETPLKVAGDFSVTSNKKQKRFFGWGVVRKRLSSGHSSLVGLRCYAGISFALTLIPAIF